MPTLTIQLPGLPPVAHVLNDETSTIGRMKGNTIVIDDSSISLSHAKITRKNGEFFLKDLNSTNGTEVNGQAINEARLRDLDRVGFASISAQFFLAETASAAVPPSSVATGPSPPGPRPAAEFRPTEPAARPAFARPAPAAPIPAQSAPRPKPTPRLVAVLSACIGGATGLAVVAFLVWRLFHADHTGLVPTLAAASLPALPAGKMSVVEGSRQAVIAIPEPAPGTQGASVGETATRSVPELIRSLESHDATERRRAAAALHALGPEAADAVPALRAALKDADQEVRMWAALTLINEKSYDKANIPVLVEVLQNPNPVLRQLACLSLGLMPYEGAEKETVIPPLTNTARKDDDEDVRKAAVSALNIIAPEALAQASTKQNN